MAADQFNENAAVRFKENVPSPEIRHSHCGPLTSSRIDWQSYLQYPFILWNPLAQFPYVFNTQSFLCPICLEDTDKTDIKSNSFLSRTNHWFNGRLKRYNPRLLYHTNSYILLVSCMYCLRRWNVSDNLKWTVKTHKCSKRMFAEIRLLLGFEYTGYVTIEHRLTNLLFLPFSSFFCPFVRYCFTPTVSSTPSWSQKCLKCYD